ncbi:MAG: acetyl-CoA C-acyltransferase FadI [Deltaproteobacteria bacterium]|nr:acetyl-CoA C-acyltransferase FadI [Deltaproteobacteria bacterium]
MTCACVSNISNNRRAVIVAGLRTPFVKAGTLYRDLCTVDLAKILVAELISRNDLNNKVIDSVIFGQVIQHPSVFNIAREIVFGIGLPSEIEAFSVSRACATSTQALVSAAQAIMLGMADVVICGGADSLSKPPITFSDNFSRSLMQMASAKTPAGKAKSLIKLRPRDFLPVPPAIKEATTGLTMGESAEKMAKENEISREEQDAFALKSHENAAHAWELGIYANEVMSFPVPPKYSHVADRDNLVRGDTNMAKMASLKPAFDKRYGTITPGNSSALTDGASALIVMSEQRAHELGYDPLARVHAWAFAGVDPHWQLLAAPPIAAAQALKCARLKLDDIDLIDMHEAFAAQVLSNIKAMSSVEFARQFLNRDEPIGEVNMAKLNIYGGSIAIGHPFAATGVRQVITMANELARRGSGKALITQCTAGSMGAALIIER